MKKIELITVMPVKTTHASGVVRCEVSSFFVIAMMVRIVHSEVSAMKASSRPVSLPAVSFAMVSSATIFPR